MSRQNMHRLLWNAGFFLGGLFVVAAWVQWGQPPDPEKLWETPRSATSDERTEKAPSDQVSEPDKPERKQERKQDRKLKMTVTFTDAEGQPVENGQVTILDREGTILRDNVDGPEVNGSRRFEDGGSLIHLETNRQGQASSLLRSVDPAFGQAGTLVVLGTILDGNSGEPVGGAVQWVTVDSQSLTEEDRAGPFLLPVALRENFTSEVQLQVESTRQESLRNQTIEFLLSLSPASLGGELEDLPEIDRRWYTYLSDHDMNGKNIIPEPKKSHRVQTDGRGRVLVRLPAFYHIEKMWAVEGSEGTGKEENQFGSILASAEGGDQGAAGEARIHHPLPTGSHSGILVVGEISSPKLVPYMQGDPVSFSSYAGFHAIIQGGEPVVVKPSEFSSVETEEASGGARRLSIDNNDFESWTIDTEIRGVVFGRLQGSSRETTTNGGNELHVGRYRYNPVKDPEHIEVLVDSVGGTTIEGTIYAGASPVPNLSVSLKLHYSRSSNGFHTKEIDSTTTDQRGYFRFERVPDPRVDLFPDLDQDMLESLNLASDNPSFQLTFDMSEGTKEEIEQELRRSYSEEGVELNQDHPVEYPGHVGRIQLVQE